MDAAVSQWALEYGKQDGDAIDTAAAQTYLKMPWQPSDLLNNAYNVTVVGSNQISIDAATKTALDGVGIDWGAY
jgi:hypothetical protein